MANLFEKSPGRVWGLDTSCKPFSKKKKKMHLTVAQKIKLKVNIR